MIPHLSSFKKFLQEAEVKPMDAPEFEGDLDALVEIVRTKAKNSFNPKTGKSYLFRGVRESVQPGVMNPGSGVRKSQNTTNFYTSIVDTNPANADFPKRASSFICTNNEKVAAAYARKDDSRTLAIYPFDGVPIGVVNKPDFWLLTANFPTFGVMEKLPALNHLMAEIACTTSAPDSMDEIIELLRTCKSPEEFKEAVNEYLVTNSAGHSLPAKEVQKKFIEEIPAAYSYDELGATLETSVKDIGTASTECWFSGKCVVIPLSLIDEFTAKLTQK